jgi:hypothetical protein
MKQIKLRYNIQGIVHWMESQTKKQRINTLEFVDEFFSNLSKIHQCKTLEEFIYFRNQLEEIYCVEKEEEKNEANTIKKTQ